MNNDVFHDDLSILTTEQPAQPPPDSFTITSLVPTPSTPNRSSKHFNVDIRNIIPATSVKLSHSPQLSLADCWKTISDLLSHFPIENSSSSTPILSPEILQIRAQNFEKLKSCDLELWEFFLPQICTVLISQQGYVHLLEDYILDLCIQSLHFTFKICCLLTAIISEQSKFVERSENLKYACQLAYINGKRPTLGINGEPLFDNGDDTELESDNLDEEKRIRFKYLWDIKRFIKELSGIGTHLQTFPLSERHLQLRIRLKELNQQINSSKSPYVRGLYLPITRCTDSHYAILQFAEHESTILNSRDKVPFYICFETFSLQQPDHISEFYKCKQSHLERLLPMYSQIVSHVISNQHSSDQIDTLDLPNESTQQTSQAPLTTNENNDSSTPTSSQILPDQKNSYSSSSSPSETPYLNLDSVVFSSSTLYLAKHSGIESISEINQPNDTVQSTSILKSSDQTETDTNLPPNLPNLDTESQQLLLTQPQNTGQIHKKELWQAKRRRIEAVSKFASHFKSAWEMRGAIIKYGTDCLQEQYSLQLIRLFSTYFKEAGLSNLQLVPYEVLVVENGASIIETLNDAVSIHQIKKYNNNISLKDYYIKNFRGPHSLEYQKAHSNGVESFAAYSLICYILQLKDRHNGNILIDEVGRIIHIDWGFLLWNTPGSVGFETAPFKLTNDFVQWFGGLDSTEFSRFRDLFYQGFVVLREHSDAIVSLVRAMFVLAGPDKMPCSAGGEVALNNLKERFFLNVPNVLLRSATDSLIDQAYSSWRSVNYDYYQYITNGILS